FAWLLTAALLAETAVRLPAQQAAPSTFRSGRDVLAIDASVTGSGDVPITDLEAKDFTVKIDGEARQVVTVHRFGATATSSGTDAPPARFVRAADAPPGRIVVIVIDRPSIKAGSERAAVESAAAVLKNLSPSDAV